MAVKEFEDIFSHVGRIPGRDGRQHGKRNTVASL